MMKKLNLLGFLIILAFVVNSLSGCSIVRIIEINSGIGIKKTVIESEEKQTKKVIKKDVELVFMPTLNGDSLGFRLQYRPHYEVESRSIIQHDSNGVGVASIIIGVVEVGIIAVLASRETEEITVRETAIATGVMIDIVATLLVDTWFKPTKPTPWRFSTTVPGIPKLIPNHPFTISLPQFRYRDTYRANSTGEFTISTDKLIDNIPNLEPLLRADSIRINASTNFDGREQQESFTIGRSSNSFQAFLEQQRLRREKPADLVTEVVFSDEDDFIPNNALDAGEQKGNLAVTIKNRGEGPGIDVQLHISSDNPHIQFAKTRILGKIESKGQRTVNIPITTNLQAATGIAAILVEAKEKRGYDAQKKQLRIHVAELKTPDLTITDVEVNDKTLGNAVGNGNGIPENDETIELNVFIKNGGVGDALGTKLELVSLNRGLDVQVRSAPIGTIRPNETLKGVLRFRIPRTFAAETLDYKLRVTEVRGADSAEKTDMFRMNIQRPILTYHISPPTSITNGTSAAFKITPSNTGKLRARNVTLKLSARNATVAPSTVNLGIIEAGSELQPQPFTVILPRTFKVSQLSLDIELSQAEFDDISHTETYSVTQIEPLIEIADRLVADANGDGKIQQGEQVEFEVTVINKGKLDVLNAQVQVSVADARIRIDKPNRQLGRLAPNYTSNPEKFAFTIPRAVPAGQLPVTVKVTHKDFPSVERTLAYTIHTEGVVTTTATPTGEAEQPQTPRPVADNPPNIVLKDNLPDTKTVYSSHFTLRASASDDKGLNVVRVTCNDMRLYDSQTDPDAARQLQESKRTLLSFDLEISLQEGENNVAITARDSNNQQVNRTLNLIYERKTNVSDVGTPRIHALLILLGNDGKILQDVEQSGNHMVKLLRDVSKHATVNLEQMKSFPDLTGEVTTRKFSDGKEIDVVLKKTQALITGKDVKDWIKETGQQVRMIQFSSTTMGTGMMQDHEVEDILYEDEHILYFDQQDKVVRKTLGDLLKDKSARLKMLITDTCSNRESSYFPDLTADSGENPNLLAGVSERENENPDIKNLFLEHVKNLFLQHDGILDITAAQPGEFALGDRVFGGFFTYGLVRQSITDESDTNKDGFLTWREVFETSKQKTDELFKDGKSRLVHPKDIANMKDQETQKPFMHSLPTPAK